VRSPRIKGELGLPTGGTQGDWQKAMKGNSFQLTIQALGTQEEAPIFRIVEKAIVRDSGSKSPWEKEKKDNRAIQE